MGLSGKIIKASGEIIGTIMEYKIKVIGEIVGTIAETAENKQIADNSRNISGKIGKFVGTVVKSSAVLVTEKVDSATEESKKNKERNHKKLKEKNNYEHAKHSKHKEKNKDKHKKKKK